MLNSLLRMLVVLALFLGGLNAAGTTIAQTLYFPDGSLASGQVSFHITAPCTSPNGNYVADQTVTVSFHAGVFSIILTPNDSCIPANTVYQVYWSFTDKTTRNETWSVPTSGTTLAIKDVILNSSPLAPAFPVQFGQLHTTAANGTYCNSVIGGAVSLTSSCPGGSGPGWVTNTVGCSSSPTFDFALGSIQKIVLSCNVTSSSVANLTAASTTPVMFSVCQDGTGGHQFTWPAAITSGVTVSLTPNKCSEQWFYTADSIHLSSLGLGVINQ